MIPGAIAGQDQWTLESCGGDGKSGNDWYGIQLRMDFMANAGDGIGSARH